MALARAQERTDIPDMVSGEGVILRRPRSSDYAEWARLRGRSRAFLTPWEPAWAPDELTRAGYRRRLRRYSEDVRQGVSAPFFVFRSVDDALVGGCNLNNIRRGVAQSCSLGYWAGENHARRGYISAAVRAVVALAFEHLGLHRVEAACIPSNAPSRGLLEKAGFQQEGVARAYLKINGVWRDHVLYARINGERAVVSPPPVATL